MSKFDHLPFNPGHFTDIHDEEIFAHHEAGLVVRTYTWKLDLLQKAQRHFGLLNRHGIRTARHDIVIVKPKKDFFSTEAEDDTTSGILVVEKVEGRQIFNPHDYSNTSDLFMKIDQLIANINSYLIERFEARDHWLSDIHISQFLCNNRGEFILVDLEPWFYQLGESPVDNYPYAVSDFLTMDVEYLKETLIELRKIFPTLAPTHLPKALESYDRLIQRYAPNQINPIIAGLES